MKCPYTVSLVQYVTWPLSKMCKLGTAASTNSGIQIFFAKNCKEITFFRIAWKERDSYLLASLKQCVCLSLIVDCRRKIWLNKVAFMRRLISQTENKTTCVKVKVKEKVNWCIAFNKKPITELQSVTCHMGSHSVSCHPTEVNAPSLNPSETS